MSRERISPNQFAKSEFKEFDFTELGADQIKELDALYAGTTEKLVAGQLIKGKILAVVDNGILVDIQYKSNGLIPRYEFSSHEFKTFKEGEEIDVILDEIENLEGEVSLSFEKAKAQKAWERITKLFEEGKPVEGVVLSTVKGGLNVDIGIPAFLPGSQVDIQRVTDFSQYVGQTITAEILKINKKRGNVIVSRRKHLSDQRADARRKAMETLKSDQVIQGIVKNITNYGVFIDIGGVDGLLHITDMTWGRIAHPSEIVKISDNVTVKILSIDEDSGKISLGLKQLSENPWDKIGSEIKESSKVKGKISSITEYGMFVEIQPGVEGLVHISEVSWIDRIENLNDHFKVAQEIEAIIVGVDKENRKLSLSLKQLEKSPWESILADNKVGDKIKGSVTNITEFGIFVQVVPGIDGLVHISDLSWTEHINHPADIYTKGQEVEAVVLSLEGEEKKVSLGIKQLTENPWAKIEEQYAVGNIIEGEVSKITNFGAFVKLDSGIEALLHISEAEAGGKKLAELVKVGEKNKFRIASINKDEQKISLSLDLEGKRPAAPAKKAVTSASKAKASATTTSSVVEKPKTALQIELEKLRGKK
jgi:small subunit ribosomal protein S1